MANGAENIKAELGILKTRDGGTVELLNVMLPDISPGFAEVWIKTFRRYHEPDSVDADIDGFVGWHGIIPVGAVMQGGNGGWDYLDPTPYGAFTFHGNVRTRSEAIRRIARIGFLHEASWSI